MEAGQMSDSKEGQKLASLHYVCQEWKVRKVTVMGEHAIQHTQSPARDVFLQQDLSTFCTQGKQ